jgi:Holliday junction resolvase RusA-like endonuclease
MLIEIPGNPVAKRRPRFFRRGKGVGTYNSQETEEGKAQLFIANQWRGNPTDKAVAVDMRFFVERPKSHFGTGRNSEKLKKSAPAFPTESRKDVDNMAKFFLDCMNGIVFRDDRQVVRLFAEKSYAYASGTRIEIEIMEEK